MKRILLLTLFTSASPAIAKKAIDLSAARAIFSPCELAVMSAPACMGISNAVVFCRKHNQSLEDAKKVANKLAGFATTSTNRSEYFKYSVVPDLKEVEWIKYDTSESDGRTLCNTDQFLESGRSE